MTSRINSTDEGRRVAKDVIHKYFTTQPYPYTKHHIDSYDQFLSTDLISILQANNPIRIFKEKIPTKDSRERINFMYNIELYIGGLHGDKVKIGTPVLNLDNSTDVRVLFPNEARLRNLTYAADVKTDIHIKVTIKDISDDGTITTGKPIDIDFQDLNLFSIPIMLHSRYCLLHGKPKEFLQQAGECPFDNGGYFIVDGSEKVLISRQEAAFNTLYITKRDKGAESEKVSTDGYVASLDPESRTITCTSFAIARKSGIIYAILPMIRAPINIFVVFRALGIQADEDIVRMIFPDSSSADAQFLQDKLIPSIIDAYPFLTKTLAIQYMKTLTKGFTEATVLDVLQNRLFTHVHNSPGARANYLAECIRSLLRVDQGFDEPPSRDDTRNQRCLNSGFLVQDMFNNAYKDWKKEIRREIDQEYAYHKSIYSGQNFINIFSDANRSKLFKIGYITDLTMKAFKGKWGSGLGEEKTGVLQALSRLSYLDFMSHCRRVVLDFDTSQKLVRPRQLHTSQYGFFCTNETPSGASIGISKNLTILSTISTGMKPGPLIDWLMTLGGVMSCASITASEKSFYVPVIINNGIIGYTANPLTLLKVLKAMKHTGFLPYFVSISFSYNQRRLVIFTDEGRPLRPLIMIGPNGEFPIAKIASTKTWRDLVMGTHPARKDADLSTPYFVDPLADRAEDSKPTAEDYLKALLPYESAIEYIDPYEQNEILIANFKEHIVPGQTTHIEIHPSTILSLLTSLIPYPNHNQSPRNQLSDSQSKQAISIYATNWKNRFDNSGHIGMYNEAPLARSLYYDYLAEGRIPYGNNCILAICTYQGYNRDDGFVFNKNAFERGLFRSIAYRSYEFFEEYDKTTNMKKKIGNPAMIGQWLDIRPGLDYTKLDERGIVKVGEYVDEDTVIVGGYFQAESGKYKDASLTPKVWTRGIVESVNITVNNEGLRLVKVRVVQDRSPELGDKFSNRHGQKGTLGALIPQADMPRTKDGIVPDVIANPHAIPSRMTMAMLLETLLGKAAACHGSIGDATAFMNEGNPTDDIGAILENMYGYEKYGNEILYDGTTGKQLEVEIFIGPAYYMRLKHMVEDKWQVRTTGRKEAKTHQPTGGRGNEGGIRFGELERDVVVTHGISAFLRETLMKRSDGVKMPICSGCGTVPIYNERLGISVCPLCQGPLKYSGTNADTLELIPPLTKPIAPIVKVEMPYCLKVLEGELAFYANVGMRIIPTAGAQKLNDENIIVRPTTEIGNAPIMLPEFKIPEVNVPELEVAEVGGAGTGRVAPIMPNLKDLVSLANQVGMTLVPSNSTMARNIVPPEEKEESSIAFPKQNNEKIIEGSADDEMSEVPEDDGDEEVQVLPGGIPQPPPIKVLGSKVPPQNAKIIQPAPLMTNEQMASMLVNTAINQPQVFAAAANQMNQAMVPTAPTVIVDTSPRALALDGLLPTNVSQNVMNTNNTLRNRRIRNVMPSVPANSESQPPANNGTIVVNKLG